jgi:hypothetical protein
MKISCNNESNGFNLTTSKEEYVELNLAIEDRIDKQIERLKYLESLINVDVKNQIKGVKNSIDKLNNMLIEF